jgi:AraC-like DNA-binding protein
LTFDRILFFLSGGGVFIGLFSALLLWNGPGGSRGANRILSLLMVLCSFNIAHPLAGFFASEATRLRYTLLVEPMQFLMAPLVVGYLHRLIIPTSSFRWRYLPHGLPCIAVIIFLLLPLPDALSAGPGLHVVLTALWVLLVVQVSAYLFILLSYLRRYGRALRDQVSNLSGVDLGWIRWFIHAIFVLYLSYALIFIFANHVVRSINLRGLLSLALCVYVFALAYRGIVQKTPPRLEMFDGRVGSGAEKYARAAVPPEEARGLEGRIRRAMETGKAFLDPELDLSGLAELVGAGRNQLSYVINQNLGKSFYDLVNEHRVREVIRLMEDPARTGDKMIAIAFDAGFNSKPTFNSVFKKITGLTPSEYRQREKKEA